MSPRPIANPLARPLYVMAKPAGSLCNLACTYCYYLEKKELYRDMASPQDQQMSAEVHSLTCARLPGAESLREVRIVWMESTTSRSGRED